MILPNGQSQMGWWKDSRLHGNCREFKTDLTVISDGWYENGKRTGPFKKDSLQYKYWEVKVEYLIKEDEF